MSPELFYPNEFGLSKFKLTKESDCYAFGMVIYEVNPQVWCAVASPGLIRVV